MWAGWLSDSRRGLLCVIVLTILIMGAACGGGEDESAEAVGEKVKMEEGKVAEVPETEAEAEAPVKPYPLNTCIVSDAELGSMGEPITYVHEGQEVKFCCAGCINEFKSDPEKYMKKLETAEPGAEEETKAHGGGGGH